MAARSHASSRTLPARGSAPPSAHASECRKMRSSAGGGKSGTEEGKPLSALRRFCKMKSSDGAGSSLSLPAPSLPSFPLACASTVAENATAKCPSSRAHRVPILAETVIGAAAGPQSRSAKARPSRRAPAAALEPPIKFSASASSAARCLLPSKGCCCNQPRHCVRQPTHSAGKKTRAQAATCAGDACERSSASSSSVSDRGIGSLSPLARASGPRWTPSEPASCARSEGASGPSSTSHIPLPAFASSGEKELAARASRQAAASTPSRHSPRNLSRYPHRPAASLAPA
mmetsp:Transcript_49414/g.115627  ORF Transcript_49414/g.115627 Transcript_49414/m.115627 type:complete len:288 (-) Transcript_49414:2854-3717(-)